MTTLRLRYEIQRTTQIMRAVVNLYFHLKDEAEAANEEHTKSDYFFNPADERLTVPELFHLCRINKNYLRRYIIDEILREKGHTVLRLPPYHCMYKYNPI